MPHVFPCPVCHATGHALIDPFEETDCPDCDGHGWNMEESAELECEACTATGGIPLFCDTDLATLYANIASLADTCIINIFLADEASVERMRAWVKLRTMGGNHPTAYVYWELVKADEKEIADPTGWTSWPGWPLTDIVYWTPGADGQLEEVVV